MVLLLGPAGKPLLVKLFVEPFEPGYPVGNRGALSTVLDGRRPIPRFRRLFRNHPDVFRPRGPRAYGTRARRFYNVFRVSVRVSRGAAGIISACIRRG